MTSAQPDEDLTVLPERYAAALRLARGGVSPERMADELGIPVESVAAVLVLAEAKLASANRRRPGPRRPPEPENGA